MHADYWIIQVWQRQRTAGLIYMYIPSIIKTRSKTLPAANQVWPRDNSCPKLLDTSGRKTPPALKLLDTSGPKILDKSDPETSPALWQVQSQDKSALKTSPALRQVQPKSAWTSAAPRYFCSFSANLPNSSKSFIVLGMYRFAQKLQFPVLFGKLTIFHATPKFANFDTL